MTTFKIAELVLTNDNRRARIMEQVAPRRYRVLTFDGQMLDVAQGDLARPGEDLDLLQREQSAIDWATHGGAAVLEGIGFATTDGHGNYRAATTPASDDITRFAERSQLGASPAERAERGLDD